MALFKRKIRFPSAVQTVESVDVARYCGTWYEASSIPRKRQRDCSNTKAEYTLTPKGTVRVRNSCRRNGRKVSVKALAKAVPQSGNAWLKVRFFGLFSADYRVIELAADYSWAVVSNVSGSALWILGRTPYMSREVYDAITETLQKRSIDISGLVKTLQ